MSDAEWFRMVRKQAQNGPESAQERFSGPQAPPPRSGSQTGSESGRTTLGTDKPRCGVSLAPLRAVRRLGEISAALPRAPSGREALTSPRGEVKASRPKAQASGTDTSAPRGAEVSKSRSLADSGVSVSVSARRSSVSGC